MSGAAEARLRLTEENVSSDGFSLRLHADEAISYEISKKSSQGITLAIHDVEGFDRVNTNLTGVSVLQSAGGVQLQVERGRR